MITLPSLHVEGLIFGSPFIELDGSSYITSSTGYTAKIEYSGKGWLSGKKNSLLASLYPTGKEKEVLYNVSGQWTKGFSIYSGTAKHNGQDTLVDTWDPEQSPTSKLVVAPTEQQHPLESRRAWSRVATGIATGDMELVSHEKGKIENAQRELRAKEKSEGRLWQRRYFTVQPGDDILSKLGPAVGVPDHGDADKTGGLWRFDTSKAEKAGNQAALNEDEASKIAKEVLGQE